MTARVSVIVPTYNHAHFLADALRSVVAQTMVEWEGIVVDDGSQDDPATVVDRVNDARIRLIRQENQGLSAARNAGIRASSAPLIALLDADDKWRPTFLEKSVQLLDSSDESIVGTYSRNHFFSETQYDNVGGHVVSPAKFREQLLRGGYFVPSSVVAQKRALERAGMFDTALTSVEDWELWLRISHFAAFAGIDEPLVDYRISPDSMSRNIGRMHQNRIVALTKHFGSADATPEAARAFGFAERVTANSYFGAQQDTSGWEHVERAVKRHPPLLADLDTFYVPVLGQAYEGYGVAAAGELAGRTERMVAELRHRFPAGTPSVSLAEACATLLLAATLLAEKERRLATRPYIHAAGDAPLAENRA